MNSGMLSANTDTSGTNHPYRSVSIAVVGTVSFVIQTRTERANERFNSG